ncbi:MAG: hypothetical protein NTV39_00925 [Candidatus Saccharibacteria bacterium]|nr:hypothetical protein [Candidatus Saccharibacteria bacterium]
MEGEDLAGRLTFPEHLPDAAVISEQALIRRFERTVVHSNGDVLMMSTDDARRVYEILVNQVEADNTAADELTALEGKMRDEIDRIAAVLPDDSKVPEEIVDDKSSPQTLMVVLSSYVDALASHYEETKITNISVEQERDIVRTEAQPLVEAIGRSAAGHMVTLSVKKEPKKA